METEIYKKMFEHEDRFWWHLGMKKIISSLLNKYLPKQKKIKILDAGCGTGGMFSTFSRYGKVWGIDKSEDAISKARLRNMAEGIKSGDIEKLPFADNSFDLAGCFDVLYHKWIKDDVKVLKEIYRVLAPGGLIIIREPAYDWLRSQHDQLVWTKHRFNKDELADKLRRAGFKIKKNSYVNFFLFPLALTKRVLEKIFKEKDPLKNMFSSSLLTNSIFKIILYIEAGLIKHLNFPFGLSIICLAQK